MSVDINDEETRDVVKKTLALTEENNRILRGMRSSARWGRFFSLLWWVIILAVTGAAYYYAQPYIEQIMRIYSQVEQGGQQAQGYSQQISDFLNQFGKKP